MIFVDVLTVLIIEIGVRLTGVYLPLYVPTYPFLTMALVAESIIVWQFVAVM
jgi:hypothetical protein